MITSNEHTIADPVPLRVSFSTCPKYLYPCNIVYKLYYENLHSYQIFYVIKNGILYTAFQWHWEHYPRKSNIAPTYMYLLAFMFVWIDNTWVVRLSHTAHQCKGSHYETSLNISNSCVGSFCSLQQWFILTTVYMLNTAPFPNPVSLLLFPLLSRTMILCVQSKDIDDSQDNCLPAIKIRDSIKKKNTQEILNNVRYWK